ncbi:MAG TPA: hybrid sensor histidine kinase/response regulator [Verrucomicrobiae bacterium]|nr:hybrid sensor histidine kinase/response regulator [Verrucomicrobiae bacterium]
MGTSETLMTEPPPAAVAEKPTLLIVDDEPGPRESLRIVFRDRYNCVVATCGREGIEYARAHAVDAAVLDIKMPDLTGVDVLRELKEIDPDIECVMLTGYETIETARAAVRYGAADYLNKPFDVFSVREILDKCVKRRREKLASEENFRTLERTNEQLATELAQLSRAVEAGVLSAGVVHEMNNPLAIIAGYADLLGRDLASLNVSDQDTSSKVRQRLASIQREIDRCKDIARRFLNFSRGNAEARETIGGRKLVEDAAALIKAHPSNRRAEIKSTAGDPEPTLKVNPAEVLQVLINLGVNALHATDGGGVLELSAMVATTVPKELAFRPDSFDPQKPMAKLVVKDNGSGIEPENISKIFQPYFTSKKEGTGLGLAIACELVARYGGAIDVESAVGAGSTFSVYLPLAS